MDNRNNIDCGYKRALKIIEEANRNRPFAGCCFPTSSTGTVGPTGPMGPTGPQGVQGIQGVQGEDMDYLDIEGGRPDSRKVFLLWN